MIPSAARPKLIVPRRPLRVAAAAVRNYNTGSTRRERLAIVSLAAAVRLGFADVLPSRLHDGAEGGEVARDIRAHLSQVLGRQVNVGLYIGPARAVRKPVLQVLDERGTTLAFAKLGVDDFTKALVRTEADAVNLLAASALSVLAVPEALHHGQWNSHELLVQRAMGRGANAASGDMLLGRAMDELARVAAVDTATLRSSRYRQRLTQRLEAQSDGPLPTALAQSLDELCARFPDTVLEFGSWHGDWAPWNMTVAGGRVCVWDWEKFESGKPIGFDAIHYCVHGATALTGVTPREAFEDTLRRSPELLRVHGITDRVAVLVFWLYVIELAVRYLEDEEMSAGTTPMSRMSEWLHDVLADVERRTRGERA